jgi:hypothetical protein
MALSSIGFKHILDLFPSSVKRFFSRKRGGIGFFQECSAEGRHLTIRPEEITHNLGNSAAL